MGEVRCRIIRRKGGSRIMPDSNTNGWAEWKRYVLDQLDDNKKTHEEMLRKLNSIDKKVAVMDTTYKLKIGLWGAIGAAIPTIIAVVYILVR